MWMIETSRRKIVSLGGIEAIISGMSSHRLEEEVQMGGCSLLSSLAANDGTLCIASAELITRLNTSVCVCVYVCMYVCVCVCVCVCASCSSPISRKIFCMTDSWPFLIVFNDRKE